LSKRLRWLYPLALSTAALTWALRGGEMERAGALGRWGPVVLSFLYVTGVSMAFLKRPLGLAFHWSFVARTTALMVLFGTCFGVLLIPVTGSGALLALGGSALIAPSVWILLRYSSSAEIWQEASVGAAVGTRTEQDRGESDEEQ